MGSQVHDNNGGIPLSGLFWTVELPRGAFHVSRDERRAWVQVKDLVVLDTFQFAGPFLVPSTVSFRIEGEAGAPAQPHGSGNSVPATDPAAFLGMIAPARSKGQFSGAELGFTFEGRGAANSEIGYAQLGTERNGVLL